MIDPSDSRGHVYLHYSGPGSGGGPPRYMELLNKITVMNYKTYSHNLSIYLAKLGLSLMVAFISASFARL